MVELGKGNRDRQFLKSGRKTPHKIVSRGRKTRDNQLPDSFFYERTTLVTFDFSWVQLSVFIIFSRLSFHVFGTNFIGFERTGDHNTPANKLDFNLHQINKGR